MRERDEDDSMVEEGSDLEQILAMLERSEIDHEMDSDDEESTIYVNDKVEMVFDEDGNLLNINAISH